LKEAARQRVGRTALAVVAAMLASVSVTAFAVAQDSDEPDPPSQNQPSPMDPITERSDQYVPKAPGTKETLKYWYGPYVVPPGWDMNRLDLNVPVPEGMVLSIEPGLRMAEDMTEPSHQVAHIHHAHWFTLNPGSETDNYFGGNADWMFGNGDEETRADFQERTAADPKGPVYGSHIDSSEPGPVIYMLHNKTAQTLVTYIALDITFIHGSPEELSELDSGRPYHDITGVLFGRTFDVPRDPSSKDGTFEQPEDDPKGYIEWTSPVDGTLIGTGSHVHPGGQRVISENYGSEERPCPDQGNGYGGTVLLKSDVLAHNGVEFSEDYQTEVTNPAWRAPIHKGDRIRIAGIYENKKHAWYTAMTHGGFYIDQGEPPKGRCKPYMVGKAGKRWEARKKAGKKVKPLFTGVPNRPWSHHATDSVCGKEYGGPPCEKPAKPYEPGVATTDVSIVNFQYQPGDMALSGQAGQPVQVKKGTSLRFTNVDQAANIRHSVTTCKWPCNGRYVANYPQADGRWDSGTLGHDVIDGGSPNPVAETPKDLAEGKYAYYCRIHPWMRGAFEVVP
jgi:plastocyanin